MRYIRFIEHDNEEFASIYREDFDRLGMVPSTPADRLFAMTKMTPTEVADWIKKNPLADAPECAVRSGDLGHIGGGIKLKSRKQRKSRKPRKSRKTGYK